MGNPNRSWSQSRLGEPEPEPEPEEEHPAAALFAEIDKDGSGTIDTSELQNLLSKLGKYLTPAELKLAVEKIDTDGSGVIEYDEFVAWYDAGGAEINFTANTEEDRKQREKEEKKAAKARAKAQKQEEKAKKLEEKAKKKVEREEQK